MGRHRFIGIVTVGRSDYGIYLPILRRLKAGASLDFGLYVAGMHMEKQFGLTVREIEADRFPVCARVRCGTTGDDPGSVARSIGLGVAGFARAFARRRPDILVVLGDRFEMYCAAVAALPFKIPVAHIHGGELTQGAFDDALRHSMTKLSHLHFVSTREHAQRVIQLGEEPWRVTVSGAPALDNLRNLKLPGRRELEREIGLSLDPAPLLVTFHPVTLEFENTARYIRELLAALQEIRMPVVFTAPNADTGARVIRKAVKTYVQRHPQAVFVENLGTRAYFGLMAHAAAMVGNSSSGLIEAPSYKLPVVNIGTRQQGRIRAANVVDVGYARRDIVRAIRRAVSPDFRRELSRLVNPYGDGRAAERIITRLKAVPVNDRLLMKRFHNLSAAPVGPRASRKCVILGGGGHAKVLIDSIRASAAANPIAVLDANSKLWRKTLLGVPILGNDSKLPSLLRKGVRHFAVGLGSIGDSGPRRRLFEMALRHGLKPLTVIHPSAVVSGHAIVGGGSQVFPRGIVNPGSKLGANVIVNTGAIVEHDCEIGDHVHVATGARLAGGVRVGANAHIGAGATIRQRASIGKGAVVGAGAVVVKDVAPWTVVAGVPAKPLRKVAR
jgi:UDP-hydrolysing UDP-N-acetyl-D-glucosamine 2-epimerase